MNKDKIIKDLKERNDKLANQYRLRDIRCIHLEKVNERLEQEINKLLEDKKKAIEYIKHSQNYGTMAQVMPHLKPYVNGDDLLEILGEKNE